MSDSLTQFFREQYVVMDAALGTQLEQRGLDCALPLWSASALRQRGADIIDIHRDSLKAGAHVISSNTFRTTAYTYNKAGIKKSRKQAEDDIHYAVGLAMLARSNEGRTALIAGSLGPLEDCLAPELVPDTTTLYREHRHSIETLSKAGVDYIAIESIATLRELRCIIDLCQEMTIPYAVLMRLQDTGRLTDGSLQEVTLLERQPPLYIGVNCLPPQRCAALMSMDIFPEDIPRAVAPNGEYFAGELSPCGDNQRYVDVFMEAVRNCLQNRVQVFGGCCGTNAHYISELSQLLQEYWPQVPDDS